MSTMIKCEHVTGTAFGNPLRSPVGQYLKSYDPAAMNGFGLAEWTLNPAEALKLPSWQAAFELWRSVPANRPLRGDGQPNRPLTAFSITFEDAP
jgi:hypothetical protein